MPKKIQISIPKPCHEDWDAMTPVEKGKFCGSCRKQVVDFSNMSDRQVAEFFKKPSTGSVCGRFMTDQLDREIEIPRKRIPWIKYFFTIALPAFVVSVKATASRAQGKIQVNEVNADTTRPRFYDDIRKMGMVSRPQSIRPFMGDTIMNQVPVPVTVNPVPVCTKPVMGKPSYDFLKGEVENTVQVKKEIKGVVIDNAEFPVSGASIVVKGKSGGVASAENGEFSINAKKGDILFISGIGFEPVEIVVTKEKIMMVHVKRANIIVVTVGLIKMALKDEIDQEIPLFNSKMIDSASNFIKVFPNPISSGSDFTIEWKQTEEGYYQFQLINQSGQAVYQKEIWIDADARLLNMDMPVIAAGTYFLVLVNKKTGKKFTEKAIVQ